VCARVRGLWQEWIEALGRNSMQIEDVLQREATSWLFQKDWKRVWREHGYSDKWLLEDVENDTESKGAKYNKSEHAESDNNREWKGTPE
jgi:hypothetical protein